jgi:hypothetical protein
MPKRRSNQSEGMLAPPGTVTDSATNIYQPEKEGVSDGTSYRCI